MQTGTILPTELINASVTVIAPHPDDELIGCLSLIETGRVSRVIYLEVPNDQREAEAKNVCQSFGMEYLALGLEDVIDMHVDGLVMLPSLVDGHPLHRKAAAILPDVCEFVGFYSTRMEDPWIQEYPNPEAKRHVLNHYYPSQADLWRYDHRYFLFEGYVILCPFYWSTS